MPNRRIFADHPMTVKEQNDRWIKIRQDKGCCVWCSKPNDILPGRHCSSCKLKIQAQGRSYRSRLKLETFEAYGGAICSCLHCRIEIVEFLTLDHIEGNDWRNYKWRAGDHLYLELRKLGYPPGFRVLCFNCNIARYGNGGICPHEKS